MSKYIKDYVAVAKSLQALSETLEKHTMGLMYNPDTTLSKATERNLIVAEIERLVSEDDGDYKKRTDETVGKLLLQMYDIVQMQIDDHRSSVAFWAK